MAFEPVSSPIKIVAKRKRFVGTSASGGVIFEGSTDGADALTCTYAAGTLRVVRPVKDESGKRSNTLTVVDESGRELAWIDTQSRTWELRLPNGESYPVSGGRGGLFGYRSTVGDLASAKAPWLAPQRYVMLTLSDAVLQRADRDLLAVVLAWVTEDRIGSAISSNQVAS